MTEFKDLDNAIDTEEFEETSPKAPRFERIIVAIALATLLTVCTVPYYVLGVPILFIIKRGEYDREDKVGILLLPGYGYWQLLNTARKK